MSDSYSTQKITSKNLIRLRTGLCEVGTSFSKTENFINGSVCTRNSSIVPDRF